jgi:hypothetical protein
MRRLATWTLQRAEGERNIFKEFKKGEKGQLTRLEGTREKGQGFLDLQLTR